MRAWPRGGWFLMMAVIVGCSAGPESAVERSAVLLADAEVGGVLAPMELGCAGPSLDVPEEYATIQLAVDAAAGGDVICVGPGTHEGPVSIQDKVLWIEGREGANQTEVLGLHAGSTFIVAGAGTPTTIRGLTIRDGRAMHGGGVAVYHSTVTLQDVRIRGCQARDGADDPPGYGGGLAAWDSEVRLERVTIEDNTALVDGGGVYVEDTTLVMENVALRHNQALWYEACFIGCVIVGGTGAGIYADGAQIDGTNVWFERNWAAASEGAKPGGGALYARGSDIRLTNATMVGNTAGLSGGAIDINGGSLSLRNVALTSNETLWGEGLTVLGSAVDISHTVFWDNAGGDHSGIPDPIGQDGNLSVDPLWLQFDEDDFASWDLHLSLDSPLIDAGDPAILDPDGSPSDIGAFGGPGAAGWDRDLDGYPAWWHPGPYDPAVDPGAGWDCDDGDPDVFPGSGC